VLLHAGYFTGS